MHTNSTPNYNLPQFVSTDKPTWLGDVNGAMSAIDTAVAGVNSTATGADSKADNAVTTANTAATTAGNAATLAETANTNANSALTTAGNAATAAQSAQSTAGAVDTKVGALTDLTTTDKTSVVAAINEVNAKPTGASAADDVTYDNTTSGLVATNVQSAIDELAQSSPATVDADNVTYDNTTSGLTATDVQAAIDELVTMVRPDGDAYEFINNGNGSVVIKKNGATVATLTTTASSYQDALITAHWTGSTDPWLVDAHAACTVDGVSYAANANVFSMPYAQARTWTGVFKAV